MSPKRAIDSEIGRLEFWGSECLNCSNATPGSLVCDDCKSNENTTALWIGSDK